MFYVVYLQNPQVNVVIPIEWVHQHEIQWQKFVNFGLNTNQMHRVFYTEDPRAYNENGEPQPHYDTNFDEEAEFFPDEGFYKARMVKFFGKSH